MRRTSLALATALVCACAPPDGEPETETEEPAAHDPRSVPPVDSWDEFESLAAPVAVEWSFDVLDGPWGDLSFPVELQSQWEDPLEADVFAFVVTPGVDEDVETQLPLWSGELTPNEADQILESIRWIDRLGFHTWRAAHHLAAQPGATLEAGQDLS